MKNIRELFVDFIWCLKEKLNIIVKGVEGWLAQLEEQPTLDVEVLNSNSMLVMEPS